jgi:hypothetical protein
MSIASGEPKPFSMKPNPSSRPVKLINRETGEVPTNLPEDYREKVRRTIAQQVLDNFYLDLGRVIYSASMQCYQFHRFHREYRDGARENRERIAREREYRRSQPWAA